jgi:hypothetical protein
MWAALQEYQAGEPDGSPALAGTAAEDVVPDGTAGPEKKTDRTDSAPGQAKEH